MAISSLGVGSGLPLDELLGNLRQAENSALRQIETRAGLAQSRLSGYGTLKAAVEALESAAATLAASSTFSAQRASSDSDVFTAKSDGSAMAGDYAIEIRQLATEQRLTTAGQPRRDTMLAQGDVALNLRFADGTSNVVRLSASQTTLEGIAHALNRSSGTRVVATLVNDGSDTPYRLQLSATDAGPQASLRSISVTSAQPDTDASALAGLLGFGENNAGIIETPARSAELSINGIAITSQGNTLETAIDGVTIDLRAPGSGTLKITADTTKSSGAIEAFVKAYNNVQGVIKRLSDYDNTGQAASPLLGDRLLRSVQSDLRAALNTALPDATLRSMAQVGIKTNPSDGTLQLDTSLLSAAMQKHPGDIQRLFAGTDGIAQRSLAAAGRYTAQAGLIGQASSNISAQIKALDNQYHLAAQRIDAKMTQYRHQFMRLDTTIAQMNSLSTYLSQQLAMLGKLNDKP